MGGLTELCRRLAVGGLTELCRRLAVGGPTLYTSTRYRRTDASYIDPMRENRTTLHRRLAVGGLTALYR